MERGLQRLCAFTLIALVLQEAAGLSLRNEQSGQCVQVQDEQGRPGGGGLALGDCVPGSAQQEWQWHPEGGSLSSGLRSGQCLSAARGHEGVRLRRCRAGEEEAVREGQAWSCSKKGHVTLRGTGLHLAARHGSAELFLSEERRGRGSRWRSLGNRTVCGEADGSHHHHHGHSRHGPTEPSATTQSPPTTHSPVLTEIQPRHTPMGDGLAAPKPTDRAPGTEISPQPHSSLAPDGPSVTFFSMEYGMGWKVTMLALSSLALVLGTVILILNVYHNRKKKTVVVLKSYTRSGEASQPGSLVPSERAPLTKHPMRAPRSPSLQRGEILIEWKDGTVTPLFDNSSYLTD